MLMKKKLSLYLSIYNTKQAMGLRKHCHDYPIVAVRNDAFPKM